MPRDTYKIENFVKGILCSADVEDIPDNACLWSTDLETQVDVGALLGRKMDKNLGLYSSSAKTATLLNVDGSTYDLIYHNGRYDKIFKTSSFHSPRPRVGATRYSNYDIGAECDSKDVVSLHTHNKEVRIARRDSVEPYTIHPVQWAGYVDYDQFNGFTSGFKVAEAEVSANRSTISGDLGDPAGGEFVPAFHRVIVPSSSEAGYGYVFAICWAGDRIYKINLTSGKVETTVGGTFSSLQGLCDDGNYLWVFDQTEENGILYRVSKDQLKVDLSCPLGNLASANNDFPKDGYISDIALTTGGTATIWFGVSVPKDFISLAGAADSGILLRTPKPSSSSMVTISGGCLAIGQDVWFSSTDLYNMNNPMTSMRRNLVVLDSTHVGYVCSFSNIDCKWRAYGGEPGNGGFILVTSATDTMPSGYGIIHLTKHLSNFDVDGLEYTSSHVYFTYNGNLYSEDVGSIPAANATVVATADTSAVCDYVAGTNNAVAYINGTTLYLVRRITKTGVDSITTSLTGLAPVYGGGNQQVAISTRAIPGNFTKNTSYFYKTNYTFDGYQDSPLSVAAMVSETREDTDFITTGNIYGTGNKTIKLRIEDISLLSARVTSINLWRASGALGAGKPTTEYLLVEEKPLDLTNWQVDGKTATCTILDTDPNRGISFEKQTGFSDQLETSTVDYALMTEMNDCLFVARCAHSVIEDATHYLFRSKPQRYDTFNWAEDFMVLPTVPTAITAYAGRLWVFDETNCYRINPDVLCIEDVFVGYGVPDQRAICITEFGMVIAAKGRNIWLYDGKEFLPIGNAIRTTNSAIPFAWADVTHTWFDPIVSYSALLRAIFVTVSRTVLGVSNLVSSYVYSPDSGRWDYWTFPVTGDFPSATSTFSGKDGELYYSNSIALYRIAGGTTRHLAWRWYSREMGMGDSTQYKKVYKVKINQTTPVSPDVALVANVDLNNNEIFVALTNDTLPAENWKRKILQFQLAGGATNKVSSVAVIFRALEGKR